MGTLLWIGPTAAAEAREAFAFCQNSVPQIATRPSVEAAFERPASDVGWIVHFRDCRRHVAAESLRGLIGRHAAARRMVLVSSNVAGEARTGTAWPGWQRVAWHAWNQWLPDWLHDGDPGVPTTETLAHLVADRYAAIESLFAGFRSAGVGCVWTPPDQVTRCAGATHVLWDAAAAPAVRPERWRSRLATIRGPARHAWLVPAPQVEAIAAAHAGGIEVCFSQPLRYKALLSFLATPGPRS